MHTREFGLFWPHFSKGDSNGGKCNKIVLRALYQPILLRLSWESRKKDLRSHLFSLKTCLQKLSIVSLELLNNRSISTKTFLRWTHRYKTKKPSCLYTKICFSKMFISGKKFCAEKTTFLPEMKISKKYPRGP